MSSRRLGQRSGLTRYHGAAVLLAATLASAIGCSERVFLGMSGSGASGGANGCAGKACGETCLVDPCAKDESSGVACQAPAAAGYCDQAGECTLNQPVCSPWLPCDPASAKCGDPCWPCDPQSKACAPPGQVYTCTDSLKCLPGKAACSCVGVDCPATLPCAGLVCGDPCMCDPELNADCQTTLSPTFCDSNNKCLPVEQVACPKGYQPCENKLCGQDCTVCKPGDMNCKNSIQLKCDLAGECTSPPVACDQPCTQARCGQPCLPCNPQIDPTCVLPAKAFCDEYSSCRASDAPTYCPCAGLSCGDPCQICDPDMSNCVDEMRQCDQSGACVPQPAPTCM